MSTDLFLTEPEPLPLVPTTATSTANLQLAVAKSAEIVISPQLRELIQKLSHCQDAKTLSRQFIGAIRLDFVAGVPTLFVEEVIWETDSGDRINTAALRP